MLISFEERSPTPSSYNYFNVNNWKWLIMWTKGDEIIAQSGFVDDMVNIGGPRIWSKEVKGIKRFSYTQQHWYCESMFYIKYRNN